MIITGNEILGRRETPGPQRPGRQKRPGQDAEPRENNRFRAGENAGLLRGLLLFGRRKGLICVVLECKHLIFS